MREFKFRAWDKRFNKYVTESFCFYASFDDDGKINTQNDIILEQFTGLKDKNGTDIFEGDVLTDGVCVTFKNGSFITTYKDDTQGGNLLTERRCRHNEVIGNIHDKN